MTKRRKRPPKQKPVADDLDAVHLTTYEITYEPIHDREYKRLPEDIKDALDRLHYDAQRKPRQAIPELQNWIKRYPQVPMFYNYLAAAYSRIGDNEKAEEITKKNIQRNPDYLFARLNYAEFCMAREEYKKVAEIFEHKFDIKMLYPKRKRFHISEVANFMGLVGVYFYEIGEREAAEKYNEVLQEIAPEYPITRRLNTKLNPNILDRSLKRIIGWLEAKSTNL